MIRRSILFVIPAASLAGCGFTLRGQASYGYAFQSMVNGFNAHSPMAMELRQQMQAQGLALIDDEAQAHTAQVVLRIHQEQRERVVVGTGVNGQVNAVQLRLRLRFSLLSAQGKTLLDEVELLQEREQTYSESVALAKEAEEQLLYRDMQRQMVQQLLRRLSAIRTL